MAKGYDDSDEAFRLVTAIRASGRNPSEALLLLVLAIVTVYKNSRDSINTDDEEFAQSVANCVLEGIQIDHELSVKGMTPQ